VVSFALFMAGIVVNHVSEFIMMDNAFMGFA
jgi:hypothetical protein